MSKKDLDNIMRNRFQQPINCCNITSLAYALSSLGFPTSIDDIFYGARISLAAVLDDGLTLAETYDACVRYIERKALPVTARVVCFDDPDMTFSTFVDELREAVVDPRDIHILNFSVPLAHGNGNLSGGHFSLVADYDPATGHITVADTNPEKYTRFWRCPDTRMYDACMDRDSASARPRGMIVIRLQDIAPVMHLVADEVAMAS